MEDYEQVTDEEKVQIASNFIKNAPPGEFNEVFNDVRVLLNNEKLVQSSKVMGAVLEHRIDNVTAAKNGDETEIVCEENRYGDSSDRFFNPKTRRHFKFDALTKTVGDFQDLAPSAPEEEERFRAKLESSFSKYVPEHYGVSGNFIVVSKGDAVSLVVEGHKYNLSNYWTGAWTSKWWFERSNTGQVVIKGSMGLKVHYFEDGNVQLVSNKQNGETTVTTDDEDDMVNKIVQHVETEENNYVTALMNYYHTMSNVTFKAFRRFLPITHTKMDWNKLAGYKVGKELPTK